MKAAERRQDIYPLNPYHLARVEKIWRFWGVGSSYCCRCVRQLKDVAFASHAFMVELPRKCEEITDCELRTFIRRPRPPAPHHSQEGNRSLGATCATMCKGSTRCWHKEESLAQESWSF